MHDSRFMQHFNTINAVPGKPTDMALVAQVRTGDGAAFATIMRRYNQRLYRVARGIVRDNAEAEDIVQEAYVCAYAKLDTFTGPAGFGAWLAKITANEALGRLRRSGRQVSFEAQSDRNDTGDSHDFMDRLMSTLPDPERLAANGEIRDLLERAIDSLPDGFRATFMLRTVEQLSVAETAECLGIRQETVKSRYHRARALLQKSLSAEIGSATLSAFSFAGARCDRIVAVVSARLKLTLN